ncbi:FRIGIDA-like protein 3 [Vitis riparia]|uniref:FRIGIDA-like protein 3 n=1 Tax=Vitis riparia TaxID=96939 RepID=UPI00155B35F4|nr:FRIGIDA-like protein 3 [Vitis riparia]
MAVAEQVVSIDSASSLIEQLGRAFRDLEAFKGASENNVQWLEIEEHFGNLETMVKKKFEELEAREKEFDAQETEMQSLIAEREAAVAAKEQDLLDQIQEVKDAAVAAIAEARAKYQPTTSEPVDDVDNNEIKVSSSLGDTNELLTASEEKSPRKTGENVEGIPVEVKPRAELTQFCEQMDAKGLLNFTMENRKNLSAIREELSVALESAMEPARLVLDSLEGFYPSDQTTQQGDKKDAALQGMRRSCLMFLEAMAALLARADPGADHLLNPETKQQAKAIADEWKPKLAGAGIDAANGNSLEAEAFLKLLATFRIASEFDEEELCKLVLAVARRRQAPELCRSLGLTHKMPGVIEVLVNGGRQIDAVHFVHAFELTERFPPVPLLKTYLKDLRRNSQGKGGNMGGAGGGLGDANAQELAALKAVIRCVEEYKLEADYALDPLQKRVAQLEKSKADKKRMGEAGKYQQPKKQRANGGFHGFRGSASGGAAAGRQAPPVFSERAAYTVERYPYAGPGPGPNTFDYPLPSQAAYIQQANDQRSYFYPQDDRVPPSSYNAAPSNYGSYMGSGLQSSHQPYM